MMRSSRVALCAAATGSMPLGCTFPTGGSFSDWNEAANVAPVNERGIKSSSPFQEPNTAVYDGLAVPWTYFQPIKVEIEKMPAPEAKYYQSRTRKPWDVSSTEWMEITARKRYVLAIWYLCVLVVMKFLAPKERSYSGTHGADGWFINLPKNQPELFA